MTAVPTGRPAAKLSLRWAVARARAIARALAAPPQLILADEPSASLDQANATIVADLLNAATRRHRITVMCATHDPVLTAAHRRVHPRSGIWT